MTNLYFVRHSKVEYTADDYSRKLSAEGLDLVPRVTEAFDKINIDAIVSSPYIRVVDTIKTIAEKKNIEIEYYDDLRERKVSDHYIDDFQTFTQKQWKDFDYKLRHGESIADVQNRGVAVLKDILEKHEGKNIIVGTHGTFMCAQLNHFDSRIGFDFWRQVKMPDIYKASFLKTDRGLEMISLINIDFL